MGKPTFDNGIPRPYGLGYETCNLNVDWFRTHTEWFCKEPFRERGATTRAGLRFRISVIK